MGREGVAPELPNGIGVALASQQQAKVGPQKVALGDAAKGLGKSVVKQSADAKVFGVLPKRRQAGVGGEVLGLFRL